ncbi:MAG: hypothetical protein G01um101448_69 [Parcubacteria group bacterium Gr01-1014_48]|nr:MAG: hypothetical protein Greene041614_151 [Parcubacteria group bacterium Greene0416_14]TSC74550.1 MAG: hypothetical protein G01um101448_69 [Parcubacteria group bacterium Gr01-1014_48]TSD01426.1 MAG: hypothetical protein Greene101415_273 [Parcubacteria group bacterium Greene1014_15]TSD08432.1 MAG: hypothetical protein Greene07144_62 [Parcubacteria group bacterium Greene0714_4]
MRQKSPLLSLITKIPPLAFVNDPLSKEQFIEIAKACDAYWIHNGDLALPHAELASGLCSNGYLNLMNILQYPNLSQILAQEIVSNIRTISYFTTIDWVFGSAYTATGLAKDVANILDAQWVPLEKKAQGEQICTRANLVPEDIVLHVEDIITTGKSALSVDTALRSVCPDIFIIPYISAVIDRSATDILVAEELTLRDSAFYPLFTLREFWISSKETCPLCTAKSERMKPKANWVHFSAP